MICLRNAGSDAKSFSKALRAVETIEGLISSKGSWLWVINNYRNSAMHREVLTEVHNIVLPPIRGEKPSRVALQFPGQVVETAPGEKEVRVPRANLKICLLRDPEDLSKGNADIEVLPYCEQSLTQMKEFLERLYSDLELE